MVQSKIRASELQQGTRPEILNLLRRGGERPDARHAGNPILGGGEAVLFERSASTVVGVGHFSTLQPVLAKRPAFFIPLGRLANETEDLSAGTPAHPTLPTRGLMARHGRG